MLDAHVPLSQQKGGTGAHSGDDGPVLAGQGQGAHTAGGELVHPAGGKAVDIPVHIAGAHAGEHHPAHVLEGEAVAGEIIAQGAEQAGDLILRPDPQHGEGIAMDVQTHHLGGGAADINSQNDIHDDRFLSCTGGRTA